MTKTFWNLWSSYIFFYFGRVNLSIVIPVLLATYEDLTLYNVGLVSTGFMAAYALGQFLHGQISEKFNPFTYLCLGLLGSALMNMLLGFTAGFFWALLVLEIMDGGAQSMGWSSTVRANAYTSKDPEKTSTILGTCYQAGNSLTWIVSGFMVGQFGWEWGFWFAAIMMGTRAVVLYFTRPEFEFKPKALKDRVKLTVTFPILLSGISLCLLNMVRFGVITWIPTYLFREHVMPIEQVGFKLFFVPLAGIVGTLLYNRIKLPKDITTLIYLTVLGIVFLLLPDTMGTYMLALLILSGFFVYGPHVFIVTTVPSRFHKESIVAAATGFINGWGYIGSASIGMLVPFILSVTGNWNAVFWFWSMISFAIAVMAGIVYARGKNR